MHPKLSKVNKNGQTLQIKFEAKKIIKCRFCLISLVANMLEDWKIIQGGINSSIWSTKTFMYNIMESRYKQIKMEHQISKISDIGQSNVLDSDVQYCITYISVPYLLQKLV